MPSWNKSPGRAVIQCTKGRVLSVTKEVCLSAYCAMVAIFFGTTLLDTTMSARSHHKISRKCGGYIAGKGMEGKSFWEFFFKKYKNKYLCIIFDKNTHIFLKQTLLCIDVAKNAVDGVIHRSVWHSGHWWDKFPIGLLSGRVTAVWTRFLCFARRFSVILA